MSVYSQKARIVPRPAGEPARTAAGRTASSIERHPAEATLETLQAALNGSPRAQVVAQLQRALNQGARVAQRGGSGDAYDDDYEDEGYDDEVDDPDLAEYLTIPDKPTLWDFLTPTQQEDVAAMDPAEQRRRANAEKRQRQMEKSRRRKPGREARAAADKDEHPERRRLNNEAQPLVDSVEEAEAELSAALRNAADSIFALGDKKARAGRYYTLIEAANPAAEWDTRKQAINTLAVALQVAAANAGPVLAAVTNVGYANLAVRDDALAAKIAAMRTFLQNSPAHVTGLTDLLTQATAQVRWLDDLIIKGNPVAAVHVVRYPNVRLHKCLRKCPLFTNIPMAELQAQTATGTHGKSPRDMKVHKKDFASRRGLLKMVSKRSHLLKYLMQRDRERYQALIGRLGLRK